MDVLAQVGRLASPGEVVAPDDVMPDLPVREQAMWLRVPELEVRVEVDRIAPAHLTQIVDFESRGPGGDLDAPDSVSAGVLVTPDRCGVTAERRAPRVVHRVSLVGALKIVC